MFSGLYNKHITYSTVSLAQRFERPADSSRESPETMWLEPGISAGVRVLAEKHQCSALPIIKLLETKGVGKIESICLSQLQLPLWIL